MIRSGFIAFGILTDGFSISSNRLLRYVLQYWIGSLSLSLSFDFFSLNFLSFLFRHLRKQFRTSPFLSLDNHIAILNCVCVCQMTTAKNITAWRYFSSLAYQLKHLDNRDKYRLYAAATCKPIVRHLHRWKCKRTRICCNSNNNQPINQRNWWHESDGKGKTAN